MRQEDLGVTSHWGVRYATGCTILPKITRVHIIDELKIFGEQFNGDRCFSMRNDFPLPPNKRQLFGGNSTSPRKIVHTQ